jgi:esterase/lipase superfamily enzyme
VTRYISFRSRSVGGSVVDPMLLVGDGLAPAPSFRPMTAAEIEQATTGRNLLLAVHGFNVSLGEGARQMAHLEARLALPPDATFFAVLWPGDFFIPVVNYPFEASDAVETGRRLAALCNRRFVRALSLSFMSHSLGGRVILEAVARLAGRKARSMCLAAAAVDRDVLTRQYARALANSESVSVLSSVKDRVLQLAYPGGDFLSDIFGDGDSPFRTALGFKGPRPHPGQSVAHHAIPKTLGCGHGDYLPLGGQWQPVAQYVRNCFDGAQQIWP